MKRKRGKVMTLIWSLVPGAAEMYMGFMKNGFSIMSVFFATIFLPFILRLSDGFLFIAILIWFYGFFHARNLAACSQEQLEGIPDVYCWEEFPFEKKIRISNPVLQKWGSVILIVYGAVLLWQAVSGMLYSFIPEGMWEYWGPIVNTVVDGVPQIAVSIVIIAIGVKLVAGKKEEMHGEIE